MLVRTNIARFALIARPYARTPAGAAGSQLCPKPNAWAPAQTAAPLQAQGSRVRRFSSGGAAPNVEEKSVAVVARTTLIRASETTSESHFLTSRAGEAADQAAEEQLEHPVSALDGGGAETHQHSVWSKAARAAVIYTHRKCDTMSDRLAFGAMRTLRIGFDFLSGYNYLKKNECLDERAILKRVIFLETVAGVPGMMGGMIRHLQSLRLMKKDGGWIHTLLEEAENERMHLMIALSLKKPGPFFRAGVLVTQFMFCSVYATCYLISPRFCHRFVGYLEEEAVRTYTSILEEFDKGNVPMFSNLGAPSVAIDYYLLPPDAKMYDVFECIRADEGHHRDVNHELSDYCKKPKLPPQA